MTTPSVPIRSLDPEIVELTSRIRTLTRQVHLLSRGIDRTVDELDHFMGEWRERRDRRIDDDNPEGARRG